MLHLHFFFNHESNPNSPTSSPQERVKELTDKFSGESEADRQKFEALLAEKNEMEMEYEDKLKQAEERSQAQLQVRWAGRGGMRHRKDWGADVGHGWGSLLRDGALATHLGIYSSTPAPTPILPPSIRQRGPGM